MSNEESSQIDMLQKTVEKLAEQVQSLNLRVLQLEQMTKNTRESASLALDAAISGFFEETDAFDTFDIRTERSRSSRAIEEWAKRTINRSNAGEIASILIHNYLRQLDLALSTAASFPHEAMQNAWFHDHADARFCWEQALRWLNTALEQYNSKLPTNSEVPIEENKPLIPEELRLLQQKIEEYKPGVETMGSSISAMERRSSRI